MKKINLTKLFDLSGKTSIVTGGAVGIGKAIVDRLSEAGASVVIADIDENNAKAAVQEFKALNRKVTFFRTDISELEQVQKLVDFTISTYGAVDILVNNAGIFPFAPAITMKEDQWDRVLDINLKGSFFLAQKAAAHMIERGEGGKIINIASIDAFHPTGNLAHYDSSKGAIAMLTKSLAKEWGQHGILVNAIAPGGINTPGAAQTSESMLTGANLTSEEIQAMMAAFTARIPVGRQGDPDEIATVALFLASPAASYIAGETVIVDGGYLLS